MKKLENQIVKFSEKTWPDSTLWDCYKKLAEEFGELAEAIAEYELDNDHVEGIEEECADMVIVIQRILGQIGSSTSKEVKKKFDIIKKRDPDRKKKAYEELSQVKLAVFGNKEVSTEELLIWVDRMNGR